MAFAPKTVPTTKGGARVISVLAADSASTGKREQFLEIFSRVVPKV